MTQQLHIDRLLAALRSVAESDAKIEENIAAEAVRQAAVAELQAAALMSLREIGAVVAQRVDALVVPSDEGYRITFPDGMAIQVQFTRLDVALGADRTMIGACQMLLVHHADPAPIAILLSVIDGPPTGVAAPQWRRYVLHPAPPAVSSSDLDERLSDVATSPASRDATPADVEGIMRAQSCGDDTAAVTLDVDDPLDAGSFVEMTATAAEVFAQARAQISTRL